MLTKTLEAGDYTFMASAGIENTSGSAASSRARSSSRSATSPTTLGEVTVSLEDDEQAAVAIVGATHTDGTTVELNCDSTAGGQFATVTERAPGQHARRQGRVGVSHLGR